MVTFQGPDRVALRIDRSENDPSGAALAFSTYFVSPNRSFWLETDNDFASLGLSQSQPAIP